jgi:hypothetical protein
MAHSTGLTTSGLLYEGSNYKLWVNTLGPILAQHFPGLSITSSNDPAYPYSFLRLPPTVRSSDLCDSIWWHVSPHVRSRVSEKDRKLPRRLFTVLHRTARPFRLMDLPVEIRRRIYRLGLAETTSSQTLTLLRPKPGRNPPWFEYNHAFLVEDKLLSINRQVRVETLPLHYREVSVDLIFNEREYSKNNLSILVSRLRRVQSGESQKHRPTNTDRVKAMHRWASTMRPGSMRHLRRISVQLPLLAVCSPEGCEDMLRFSLSVIDGKPELRVAPHPWLKPVSQELLREHLSTISNLAHTLKLQGEALIMALVSRPEIWDQLELADK